jgi:hypothetical protein
MFAPDFARSMFAGCGSLITAIGAPPAGSEPEVQVTVVIVRDPVPGREFQALLTTLHPWRFAASMTSTRRERTFCPVLMRRRRGKAGSC